MALCRDWPAAYTGIMNSLIVFDCDGTLVDSQHVIVAAVRAAFAAHGLPSPGDGAIRHIVGLSLNEAMAELLGPDPLVAPERLAASYREAFLDLRQRDGHRNEPLYEGIAESLEALKAAGLLLAIATGKSARGLEAILAHHGLSACFISLQTADSHPSKPHPAMLRAAIAEAGAEPATTVMIGDTSYDMTMARKAGTLALGVSWGYHEPRMLRAAGADHIVDDAHALPEAIAALLKE
ncbi:MAG: HAD family hydrolase [Rhodothalassiaceae bacterium]